VLSDELGPTKLPQEPRQQDEPLQETEHNKKQPGEKIWHEPSGRDNAVRIVQIRQDDSSAGCKHVAYWKSQKNHEVRERDVCVMDVALNEGEEESE
jgi:hypothetical protein